MRTIVILAVVAAVLPAALGSGIFQDSYNQTVSFANTPGANQHPMGIAFDGTYYWSCDGGSTNGVRLSQYAANGNWIADFSPNIDFRSSFTLGTAAPLYAREFSSSQIRVQTAPGVFGDDVQLTGGSLDAQSSVVFSTLGSGTDFIAMNTGTVSTWARTGAYVGATALTGFGSMNNEGEYPANRGIASAAGYYLSYSAGVLSGWDASGARVGTTALVGAGTVFDSLFSFSYANNMVFVVDSLHGSWRGYAIPELPEPASLSLLALAGLLLRRR